MKHINLTVILMFVVLVCHDAMAAEGPATRPSATIVSSNQASTNIAIPIAAGKTYFAAYGTDESLTVDPILSGRFNEDGRLDLTFIPGRMEEGDQKFWRVKLVQELHSGGVRGGVSGVEFTFRNGLQSDASKVHSADIPVVINDVSKSAGLSGLSLYQFAYAKVGEEVRFVVVAVADDPAIFARLFSVSPDRKFDWNKWPEVK